MRICSGGGSPFPEILESSAEPGAAQGDDGVGTGEGPSHAGALETVPDHALAAGLDHPRGDAEPLSTELRTAHPVAVAEQTADAPAGFGGGLFVLRVPGGGPQRGGDPAQPPSSSS